MKRKRRDQADNTILNSGCDGYQIGVSHWFTVLFPLQKVANHDTVTTIMGLEQKKYCKRPKSENYEEHRRIRFWKNWSRKLGR
jgi:hypothetical protein